MALFLWCGHTAARKIVGGHHVEEEMRDHLAVDSLKFISMAFIRRSGNKMSNASCPQYCDACFSGEYPVAPSDMIEKGFAVKAAE